MICPKCNNEAGEQSFCPYCGTALTGNAPAYAAETKPEFPMKWFKFLIYFSLFAAAVLNGLSGISTLTGAHYGGLTDTVYAVFGGMQAVDLIFGLGMIGLAAFNIYTRVRLAGFYQNGPKMLTLVYMLSMVLSIGYVVAAQVVCGGVLELDLTSLISNVITSVVMIIINGVYFTKRAALFVNE